MKITEAFTCPRCAHPNPTVLGIQTILNDVRYDIVKCPHCGTEWRVYYKVSDVNTEVTYVAPEQASMTAEVNEHSQEGSCGHHDCKCKRTKASADETVDKTTSESTEA